MLRVVFAELDWVGLGDGGPELLGFRVPAREHDMSAACAATSMVTAGASSLTTFIIERHGRDNSRSLSPASAILARIVHVSAHSM